jgi:hypothetical protein
MSDAAELLRHIEARGRIRQARLLRKLEREREALRAELARRRSERAERPTPRFPSTTESGVPTS